MRVLCVAGEPSGDRALAAICSAASSNNKSKWVITALGGDSLATAGAEILAHIRDFTGMGLWELGAQAPAIARTLFALSRHVHRNRPDVGILASWSSANARIGRLLRALNVPVVWVSPPEVWAWGRSRASSLARSADLFFPTLPFEPPIWTAAGANVRFLGHPSVEVIDSIRSHNSSRDRPTSVVALLPGSRAAEVSRLLPTMLAVVKRLGVRAEVLTAPSMSHPMQQWVSAVCDQAEVQQVEVPNALGAGALLPRYAAALVCSGTASLECALAAATPVILYGMHPITFAIAKRLVRTPYIGLPNVLLNEPTFDEHIQTLDPISIARSLDRILNGKVADRSADLRALFPIRPFSHAACEQIVSLVDQVRTATPRR